MSSQIGVAISTTGDEHRLGFLETSVRNWQKVIGAEARIVVTVDAPQHVMHHVVEKVFDFADVWRVGQPEPNWPRADGPFDIRDGRLGVAVNKNTGLEALMNLGVEHLFLCDDDTWPVSYRAVKLHMDMEPPHSMVCWGQQRNPVLLEDGYATWDWPRGVLMYQHRSVVDVVGGLREEFGPGGHEHVEWSRRIHKAGFTPAEFISPGAYAGERGQAVRRFWNCEDMRKPGEPLGRTQTRRQRLTTIRRVDADWPHIERIMVEKREDTAFVPFRAAENHRESATLWSHLSDDQGVVQAKEPGSE